MKENGSERRGKKEMNSKLEVQTTKSKRVLNLEEYVMSLTNVLTTRKKKISKGRKKLHHVKRVETEGKEMKHRKIVIVKTHIHKDRNIIKARNRN